MIISGIQKFTLLDYPGKVACVIFTGGCNFRCGFCHNPEFVLPEKLARLSKSFIPEEAILHFLKRRQGLLQGVVISGGEPTIMHDLERFIVKVKAMGFSIKLDSNGNHPAVLRRLIEKGLVDYIAMDFKTSLPTYTNLVGQWAKQEALLESIALLKEARVEYEFRTTLIQEVHTPSILEAMRDTLQGAKKLYLQTFRNGITLSPLFQTYHPFTLAESQSIARSFMPSVAQVFIRE